MKKRTRVLLDEVFSSGLSCAPGAISRGSVSGRSDKAFGGTFSLVLENEPCAGCGFTA